MGVQSVYDSKTERTRPWCLPTDYEKRIYTSYTHEMKTRQQWGWRIEKIQQSLWTAAILHSNITHTPFL